MDSGIYPLIVLQGTERLLRGYSGGLLTNESTRIDRWTEEENGTTLVAIQLRGDLKKLMLLQSPLERHGERHWTGSGWESNHDGFG
jgi:hypothetical protein